MDTISFARGVPAPECLPVDELADCARAVIERDGRTVLSYGPGAGYPPLRELLGVQYGVDPGRVVVTNGSLQGFAFLARHFAGRRVLVEGPTYDRPLKILAEAGCEPVVLPLDDDGLDPELVERALRDGPEPAFLYTIPTFQNPSGRTLGLERRRRLVELAHEHRLLVLEDDPYGLVRYEGRSLPTLFELAGGDGVIYASSFSKTVAPGVRVGYFVSPPALAEALQAAAVSTYVTPVLLAQATVYEFLRRGRFGPNLDRVRALLGARRDAMLAALERELSGAAAWSNPEGGYFVWVDFAGAVDVSTLLERAEQGGVTFVPGTDFYPAAGGGDASARLAFSFSSEAEIAEGVRRLAAVVPAAAAAP